MRNTLTDIIVIGGGASGMMAAITAARAGRKVLILEHNESLGKKILATGNGRCNFTNIEQGAQYYRSESPDFVLPSLKVFDASSTIRFFEELGIMTTERNGYYYPRTMQASVIRNCLIQELHRLNVRTLTDVGIRQIRKENDTFVLDTKSGIFTCSKCILATGGKSDPKSGSDGSGYIYAKQLGHNTTTTVPALVPLVSDAKWLKDVKGVRQDAKVTLFIDHVAVASDQGEVQFTDYGISGIPTFQISRFAAVALEQGLKVMVSIDFVPDVSETDLHRWIQDKSNHYSGKDGLQMILDGIVNQKLSEVLMREKTNIVKRLKHTEITIVGTKPFAQAQVTAGGIDTKEICADTMESKFVSGLYFAGEMIDVDGMCGGYNLQWAWASGFMAGRNAAETFK